MRGRGSRFRKAWTASRVLSRGRRLGRLCPVRRTGLPITIDGDLLVVRLLENAMYGQRSCLSP